MEALVLINIGLVAAIALVTLRPAYTATKRMGDAVERLADSKTREAAKAVADIAQLRRSAARRAGAIFFLVISLFWVVGYFAFDQYAQSVEPKASLGGWLQVQLLLYGLPLLAGTFLIGYVVSVAWQLYKVGEYLKQLAAANPRYTIIQEAKTLVTPGVSEVGLSVVGVVAVIMCTLYGLTVLAILYSTAQTAIDCARSSKCI